MIDSQYWSHVFKLDPDKPISDEALEAICESGTDAVIIGGTYGITYEKVIDLLGRIRRYALPCVLEVSNQDAIVPGFDHYFVPLVLNATNPEWILKPHQRAIKAFGTMIPWEDVSVVGYCVLNPASAVSELTQSETNLSLDDVVAYGRLAAHMLKLPYFYLEYSGTVGEASFVQAVYQQLKKETDLHLFYGGGISNRTQAETMLNGADTVVVGNVIYEDLRQALQTVPEGKR
ncbi:Geranylgeranylglyceryl phosphate synthase [Caldalkalibacillus thermarum TA2.A1]|uniref:Heptaprenylglyceryl phosphate synthase n=1 Tax=Caldalkalibacillus thermarum (strain TA2.A1) TaxID=986075 RepID=F5L443_CALTT|nr:heptaprenylglyceryl phosphate synthase [Caldalkalibacillus thermarum]EGL83894.1 Geranylgeranylglyceryl phosphate synthase [Caldalkalibacillus thermarum TA2.A1]QZT34637.1 heptaprenylglyceryl phosphate synthase [Caldalkalibacillus thermarum TA2.A1]